MFPQDSLDKSVPYWQGKDNYRWQTSVHNGKVTGNRPDPPLPLARLSCPLTLSSVCRQLLSPGLDQIKLSRHRCVGMPSLSSLCGLLGTEPQPSGRKERQPTSFFFFFLSQDPRDLTHLFHRFPPFPNQLARSLIPEVLSPLCVSHSQSPNPLGG